MKISQTPIKSKPILVLLFLATYVTRTFAQVDIQQIGDQLDSDKDDMFRIVNIVMTVVLFAGVIYIATNLLAKREQSKGIIVSWIVAMVIWGIANAILS